MRRFEDCDYVLEHAIKGDLALIRADTADLYTEVSRDVDKYLWFLEAHLQAKR